MSDTIFERDSDIATALAKSREADDTPSTDDDEVDIEDSSEGDDNEPELHEDATPAGEPEEGDDADDEELSASPPPDNWPHAEEDWDATPAAVQELYLEQAAEVHKLKSDLGRETAEARKTVDAEKSRIAEKVTELDDLTAKLSTRMKTAYDGVDWAQLANDDPDEYTRLKAQREQDEAILAKAEKEAADLKTQQVSEYTKAQHTTLLDRNPQYRGDKGREALQAEAGKVQEFVVKEVGISPEALTLMSAQEYEIARDAMLYRQAQKTAKTTAPKKKRAGQKAVRPGTRKTAAQKTAKGAGEHRKAIKQASEVGGRRVDAAVADALAARRKR